MKIYALPLLSIFLLSIAGCGGGSSSSSSSSGSATLTLGGVASKGLLQAADVQAYEVVNGALISIGSSVRTDNDGAYSLTGLPSTTNPVVVKVTTNASTEMLDETLPLVGGKFQKGTKPKVGTEMRSMIESLSSNSEVVITPFTEMAVSAAAATGTLDAQSLAASKLIMTESLGIDPFKTKPINADQVGTMTPDQGKLMALLTSVAIDAQTSCPGDASGVSCAIVRLNNSAEIKKNSDGTFAIKTTGTLNAKLTSMQAATASYSATSSAFLTSAKSTSASYVVPTEPLPIDSAVAKNVGSMEAFVAAMRLGFNRAQKSLEVKGKEIQDRLDLFTVEIVSDTQSQLDEIGYNCKLDSSDIFVCDADNNSNFTFISEGKYTFTKTNSDQAYKIDGTAEGSLDGTGKLVLKVSSTKINTGTNKPIEELAADISGTGLLESSKSSTLYFSKLEGKQYDQTSGSTKWAKISLTGLTLSVEEGLLVSKTSVSVPITGSTSEGDSFSGKLNKLALTFERDPTNDNEYRVITADIDISANIIAANSNLASISLKVSQKSTTYRPWLPNSSDNVPEVSLAFTSNFTDDVTLEVTRLQNTFDKALYSVKMISNRNWIKLEGEASIDSKEIEGISELIVTSNGEFNMKINPQNEGKIYKGTDQIGWVKDGIMYIAKTASGNSVPSDLSTYKQVSFR